MDVLDPTLDVVFKMLFADEKNKPLLISLLSAVLLPTSPILDVHILNPEIPKEFAAEKGIFLDIFLRLQNETQINVEMQSTNFHNVVSRTLFYWAKAFTKQLTRGNSQTYSLLKPTSCIMFLDFVHFANTPNQLHSEYELKEINTGHALSPLLKLHFIELPKLKNRSPKLHSSFPDISLWVQFLTCKNETDLENLAMSHPMLKQAKDALVHISSNEKNRIAAEARKKALLDYHSGLFDAKAEGIAKGEQEKSRKIARNLLEQGMSLSKVAEMTELSLDEVKKLADQQHVT